MKRLLSFLLVLITTVLSFAQPGFRALIGSSPYVSTTQSVNSAIPDFRHNQYAGSSVQLNTLTIGTSYRWRIYDSDTHTQVDSAFTKNPTITSITSNSSQKIVKFYDVHLTVKSATDSAKGRWIHGLAVFPPLFTEVQADYVINLTSTGHFHNFLNADYSGKKIYIKGTATSGNLELAGLQGTEANPVYIICDAATMNGTGGAGGLTHAVYLETYNNLGASHIIFHGYDKTTLARGGLTVVGASSASQVFYIDGLSTNVKVFGVDISATATTGVGAGFSYQPPTPTSGFDAASFVNDNSVLYDCYIHRTGEEGVYEGHFEQIAVSGRYHVQTRNFICAYNTITNTGRDGIQPGACINVSVHDNDISNWGVDQTSSHESGISINGGGYGYFFNNKMHGGKKCIDLQSGPKPFDILGGQTVPQPTVIFCNECANLPYTNGGTPEPDAIYIQNSDGTGSPGVWPIKIINNTFFLDKKFTEQYVAQNSFVPETILVNNVVVKVADAGFYDDYNITGNIITCDAASTVNIASLSGFLIIDGFQTSGVAAVVLLKNQTNQTQNGIWFAASGAWARHNNADTDAEIRYVQGRILSGSTNAKKIFRQTTASPTIGSSNIVFSDITTGITRNNLVRELGTESDLYLSSTPSDLTVNSFLSEVYNGTTTNLATYSTDLPSYYLYDLIGAPLKWQSYPYTFGAHSGSQKR